MSQYALPLPHSPDYTEERFVVSACNEEAWRMVSAWPRWGAHALFLAGGHGSGKSHMGHIWARKAGAKHAFAQALPEEPEAAHWLVEDVDGLAHPRALFHLFNATKEQGFSLLITGLAPPAQMAIALPDLASRLRALPVAVISAPDDMALAAVMRKQFADRQLKVEEDVIGFVLPRLERSFEAVGALVSRIDAAALASKRNITVPLVRRVLGEDGGMNG